MPQSKPESIKKPATDTPAPRKPTRLGKGLSALMGQPVQVFPPSSSPSPPSIPQPPAPPPGNPAVVAISPQQNHIAEAPAGHSHSNQLQDSAQTTASGTAASFPTQTGNLTYLPVGVIKTNPHQPRKVFNQESLNQLANSIRNDGLMQPIIVRHAPSSAGDSTGPYELVAGERRLRAAQMAGLTQLPAIVRSLDSRQLAEWALIENLQREDLNPIDRANAFQHLIDEFNLSHDQIAQQVGIERSTVSNSIRLLNLCEFSQSLIRDGLLSAGQAKALAGVSDPEQQKLLSEQAVAEGWSVRRVEQAVKAFTADTGITSTDTKKPTRAAPPAHLADLERLLGQQLQTKVKIRPGRKKGAGTLSIDFYSLDQFDALMQRLDVQIDSN